MNTDRKTANRTSTDSAVSNQAYYPICSRNNESFGISNNTAKMFFSSALFGQLRSNSRLDKATLKLFQRAHSTNMPPNGSCSEPNERIFVTISVLIRRVHNGEVRYTKRDCDTISRSINNSSWMELDVVDVIRHWQKSNRSNNRHINRSAVTEMMLTIDVHDHDRNELNASQYFVPMDCQAYATAYPWELYDKTVFNLSGLVLPQYPRLDFTTSHTFQQSSQHRGRFNNFDDRFHRLEQLHQSSANQNPTDIDDEATLLTTATQRRSGRHNGHQERLREQHHHSHRHHQQRQRQRSRNQHQTHTTTPTPTTLFQSQE